MAKHSNTSSGRRTNTAKIMISLGVLGAAAAVAGMGTFGTFTSTTSGSQAVASGTVNIALGGSGGVNDFSIAATTIVPGDTIQRAVTLSNTGTADLGGVSLSTTASPATALTTNATNGLQMDIKSCAVAWQKAGAPTAPTYTCSGATTVLASRPVATPAIPLNTTRALPAGAKDNLMVTLTLPAAAGNEFQGLASTINYTFTGTQRAATNR